MVWNISAECVSVVILCIIWIYSRKGNPLPTLQNKFFQVCFFVTFIAIISNIAATFLLYHYQVVPPFLNWTVNTLYFATTPLMGVFYFYYVLSFIFENPKKAFPVVGWASVPAAVYLIFVFVNPATKLIFDIDPAVGYVRGPFIIITYVVFYIYCFACLIAVLLGRKRIEPSIGRILASFPLIAAVVIVIQQFAPEYILSGSAATCALLIIYLYLQNKQISIDYLTGLSNRQEFLKMLELRLHHNSEKPFTILVLSLKGFKTVNDKFGQHSGNHFLQAVAAYLKTIVSSYRLYRYSGDEFAILLNSGDNESIRAICAQLQHRMSLPWETKYYSFTLSYALAVVGYPNSANGLEGLIDGIESTVSQAKRSADHYSYCTQEMLDAANRRNQIVDILKERLESNSFELYYQPILSLDSCMFNRAEALLRLNDTPIGPVYPSEFIPIAEETGLIIEMTYQVLDKVCKFVKKLMDRKIDIMAVSVNFSSVQFVQPDIAGRVTEIIEANQIPFSKIKIEITESVLAENLEAVRDFIDFIHEKGVKFALDDFGMGYSNISTVLGFPISTVKLDKSLVWSSVEDCKSETVVRHMVSAFKELGIHILAEGVENELHRQFVEDCGSDMIQGFLYARPMAEADAGNFLGKALSDLS